jgi:glutathione S-transferase
LIGLILSFQDSQSQRILWLLEELEISYDLVLHKRHESGPKKNRAPDSLKETHPLGKAPQLVTVDGRVIIESLVIADYLINTYDKESRFKGSGEKNDRLRDEELCNIASSDIGPLMTLELVFDLLTRMSPFFIRPIFSMAHRQLQKAYSGPEIELLYQYLDHQLEGQDYFMGSPGRADFIIKWPVDMCVACKIIDLTKYPNLDKWYTRVNDRPAWKRSLEKGNGYNLETSM